MKKTYSRDLKIKFSKKLYPLDNAYAKQIDSQTQFKKLCLPYEKVLYHLDRRLIYPACSLACLVNILKLSVFILSVSFHKKLKKNQLPAEVKAQI
ncbi:hypothetical protein DB41_DP00150 [Neochlamydia sp. TUME1]|nr:hypothetical protein DB41_DP00150 [Neochlamydia sp. TUME1]